MGAEPAWATLALTLPKANEQWLTQFSQGFFDLLNQYNMQLIGGDITHGPLTISVQTTGFAPKHHVLTRAGTKVGDEIYVTDSLGTAAFALAILQNKHSSFIQSLNN